MRTEIPLLQNVRVAAPCSASWSAMTEVEGDRVRFCDSCRMNVYNLSAMGQAEAEGLLRRHEGRLCVRYFQRKDGTILTKDCPVGKEAVRLMFLRRSVVTATLFILGLGLVKAMQPARLMGDIGSTPAVAVPESRQLVGVIACDTIPVDKPEPVPIVKPDFEPTMGSLAVPPPSKPEEVMGDVAPVPPVAEKPEEFMGKPQILPPLKEELGGRMGRVARPDTTQEKANTGDLQDK